MNLSTSEKIRTALIKSGVNIGRLADLLGQSRQNLSNKLTRDNFSIKELKQIAEVLNIDFEYTFIFKDGTKI